MHPGKSKRRTVFVNRRIQGAVLLRFMMYWFGYHFLLWHTLFLFHFLQYRVELLNGGTMQSFSDLYLHFTLQYYPLLLAAVGILPMLIYDSVLTTHRIAGPLVRFQAVLRQLQAGAEVREVRLREGDLLTEFRDEFNRFLAFYQEQRRAHLTSLAKVAAAQASQPSVPATPPQGAPEESLLNDARELTADVQENFSAAERPSPWVPLAAPLRD